MMLSAACLAGAASAQQPRGGSSASGTAKAQHERRLRWWRDARFGMFIHWGPVSLKGTEIGWSRGAQVPIAEYDALYKQFDPVKFDADAWVSLAKAAGMKYIVFTTKHHDGFCMFDTKQTDYSIMNSPFHRDVVKELAAACRKHGIAFGTYHSVVDWHHPDHPHGSPGGSTLKPNPNLDRYETYLKNQVAELIHNYGPLLVMWFDVAQDFDAARGARVVNWTRSLQPDILVNNRCANPGDFDTPEQTVGRYQTTRPWESCITICQQWAWKPNDQMKSLEECLQTLVRCAGGDGNLLFNVGPMPTGEIEARQAQRLREMGAWLKQYGSTVYRTRGGPFRPGTWGASTCRGNIAYIHVMKWPEGSLVLPPINRKVLSARALTGGQATVAPGAEGLVVSVPAKDRKPIDTIVELKLDGPAFGAKVARPAGAPVSEGKPAKASNVFQGDPSYGPDKAMDGDEDTRWATDAGTHAASIEVDLGADTVIDRAHISEAFDRVQAFELQRRNGDTWEPLTRGTTIGQSLDVQFKPVSARVVRLNILQATEGPTLWTFELFAPRR